MGLGSDIPANHTDSDASDSDGDGDVDAGRGHGGKSLGTVSCSICLELVTDNGDRSWAKLQCGHRFHLDCIGSAFNVKGAMQCPNCRKIEKGQWLYANGCRSFPDFNIQEWTHDEDLHDLSHSEMSFGVHWCPFGGVTRLTPSFEDGELSSSSYHDLLGQHPIFAEQSRIPSATHPCPYIAYLGPVHPSSSNSSPTASDTLSSNNPWNVSSAPGEMPASYVFPSMDHHDHNREHHSSRIGNADQPRSPRNRLGLPGSASVLRPFTGHSSNTRASSSVTSATVPPYPGSNVRNRDRVQALQAYNQLLQPIGSPSAGHAPMFPGTWRSSRTIQVGHVASSSDWSSGNFCPFPDQSLWEGDHPLSFSQAERDSRWEMFHRAADGSRGFWGP